MHSFGRNYVSLWTVVGFRIYAVTTRTERRSRWLLL